LEQVANQKKKKKKKKKKPTVGGGGGGGGGGIRGYLGAEGQSMTRSYKTEELRLDWSGESRALKILWGVGGGGGGRGGGGVVRGVVWTGVGRGKEEGRIR